MSNNFKPEHPQEIYTPGWHETAKTPVIDGKYYDPVTGELCTAQDHVEYSGPPAVDIIVTSLHADTADCVFRAARPFPLEILLSQVMRVVQKRSIKLDSLTATPYAIRVVLACELTADAFYDAAGEMVNGVWAEG